MSHTNATTTTTTQADQALCVICAEPATYQCGTCVAMMCSACIKTWCIEQKKGCPSCRTTPMGYYDPVLVKTKHFVGTELGKYFVANDSNNILEWKGKKEKKMLEEKLKYLLEGLEIKSSEILYSHRSITGKWELTIRMTTLARVGDREPIEDILHLFRRSVTFYYTDDGVENPAPKETTTYACANCVRKHKDKGTAIKEWKTACFTNMKKHLSKCY